jgi:hypothetical protein
MRNRTDELVDELLDEGRFDELEGELLKFDPGKLEGAEKGKLVPRLWHHPVPQRRQGGA